jgi:hypothetical protein
MVGCGSSGGGTTNPIDTIPTVHDSAQVVVHATLSNESGFIDPKVKNKPIVAIMYDANGALLERKTLAAQPDTFSITFDGKFADGTGITVDVFFDSSGDGVFQRPILISTDYLTWPEPAVRWTSVVTVDASGKFVLTLDAAALSQNLTDLSNPKMSYIRIDATSIAVRLTAPETGRGIPLALRGKPFVGVLRRGSDSTKICIAVLPALVDTTFSLVFPTPVAIGTKVILDYFVDADHDTAFDAPDDTTKVKGWAFWPEPGLRWTLDSAAYDAKGGHAVQLTVQAFANQLTNISDLEH